MASKTRSYARKTTSEPEKPAKPIDLTPVGKAFDSIMDQDIQRKEESSLSKTERALLVKERNRQRARKENRAGYDIGAELKDKIAEIAKKQGTTNSQLAAWILWGGIKDLERAKDDVLSDYKKPSLSIHHEWNLDLEKRRNE